MNLGKEEAIELIKSVGGSQLPDDVRVMVFPTNVLIGDVLSNREDIEVGAQNFYPEDKGAFTGEVSLPQLRSMGCNVVLIGHSERREYFNEDNSFLKKKVDACLGSGVDFIFCCGEPLAIRETGREQDYVKAQLEESLFHLSADEMRGGVIAYEPIWAIGTGKTASSEQAEEMHANIRKWIADRYSSDVADSVSILYGGSCKPSNSKELFACENVDGGLIGGASLDADAFVEIINSY